MTNIQTEEVEKSQTNIFFEEKIKAEIGKVLLPRVDVESKEEIDKLGKEAEKEIDYIIPHQDCWILNAKSAINMVIE